MTIQTKLSIDKISITARDHDPERVIHISRKLQELAGSDQFDRYGIKPSRWRHFECSIPLPTSSISRADNHFRFEVGAKHSAHPAYRCEFNPAKIAPDGINDVLQFLKSATGISLDHIISSGIVTRIDLALNLYGLSLDNSIVRSRGAQKVGLYSDRYGNPEWVALGSPRSNRTIAYAKNDNDGQFLRLERRLKPRLPLCDLPQLTDPFAQVQLIPTESFLPFLDKNMAEFFFDSVRIRGLNRAIKMLQPKARRAIKAMLRDPAASMLPSTTEIWKDWPQLLKQSGFAPFLIPVVEDEVPLAPGLTQPMRTDHG